MEVDEIKRSFVAWVNRPSNTFPERLALRDGEVWILKESSSADELPNDIRIRATDREWIEYFQSCSVSDEHPISLMWVHLNETVAEAEKYGGDTAIIGECGIQMNR